MHKLFRVAMLGLSVQLQPDDAPLVAPRLAGLLARCLERMTKEEDISGCACRMGRRMRAARGAACGVACRAACMPHGRCMCLHGSTCRCMRNCMRPP